MSQYRYRVAAFCLAVLSCCYAPWALAAQFETVGDYVIHYNAVNTSMLQPEVAKNYEIVRSKNRALLNIAVRKKGAEATAPDTAASAQVKVSVANLNGQLQQVNMREIREGEAIYYIGVFNISNAETLDFKIEVAPEMKGTPHAFKFRQEFFTTQP